ncbi:hypothetical protein INS49_013062 [Diaporthe citri]|uniref:uncharacterized protein n=1 Tax=Diaporthe citri TaxID=83186 RepID=UPI001C7E2D9F|nr:uncharacterized protein INS49_013062 [Diaporthe citri]KAG6359541.1 hypothetical protein INS49_013062 [Diaporthe citri]
MPPSKLFKGVARKALKAFSVVSIGGISYFVGNAVELSLPEECDTAGAILPVLVFELNDQEITKHAVLERFEEFAHRDDVFHMSFTEGSVLILRSDELPASTHALPESLTEHLNLASSKLFLYLQVVKSFKKARVSSREELCIVLGNCTAIPAPLSLSPSSLQILERSTTRFEPLKAGAYSGLHRVVAVPSRLYFEPSREKPLAGLRVTVKDNYK